MKRNTKVGIVTSGGDCQGLNAAIRGIGKALLQYVDNVEIFGMYDGYRGLIEGDYKFMESKDFSGILTEGGQAVKSMVKRFFQIPAEAAKDIPAGHGGIVFLNGKKAGVYRDESGALHPVDIRCPHLGCQLEWDPDEKTWDCPCHGSRFDCLGRLISGPAQTDLDSSLRTGRRSLPPSVERSP